MGGALRLYQNMVCCCVKVWWSSIPFRVCSFVASENSIDEGEKKRVNAERSSGLRRFDTGRDKNKNEIVYKTCPFHFDM